MAMTIPRWIMGVSIGCAAVVAVMAIRGDRPERAYWVQRGTPEALAANRATRQYRRAYQEWRAIARRDSIVASLSARPAAVAESLVVRGSTGVSRETVAHVERLVRRQASGLGIDRARARVTIAVVTEARSPVDLPAADRGGLAFDYIVPPSAPPGSCVVVVVLRASDASTASEARITRMLGDVAYTSALLGPCGFFARFGAPGPAMERWLMSRGYDLARTPNWRLIRSGGSRDVGDRSWRRRREHEYFSEAMAPGVRACVAGRIQACEAMVAEQPPGESGTPGLLIRRSIYDGTGSSSIVDYLSDLVSYAGADRVAPLWTGEASTLAFSDAAGESIGEWTRRWLLAYYPSRPRIGPGIGIGELAVALAGLLASIGVAVLVASRRQVG